MKKPPIIPGAGFGRLTVLSYEGKNKHGHKLWYCQCTCGKTKIIPQTALNSGDSQSCGCLHQETSLQNMARRIVKHQMCSTPEYKAWRSMKERCANPKHRQYKNYGARGITVCTRWKTSFENFYQDLGPRPGPTYSLDRKENNNGYYKKNCRWATSIVQNRNKRTNIVVTHNGLALPISAWAELKHLTKSSLGWRLRHWSVEEALLRPTPLEQQRGCA